MSTPGVPLNSSTVASSLPNLAPTGSTGLDVTPPVVPDLPFTDAQVDGFREQDRWLPIANVARIMKNSLPLTAKVSKEAKECVQECVSEFISFITSEAAEKCSHEKRKTINGEDILTSMRSLGFDNYEGVLKVYLAKYREHQLTLGRQRHLLGDELLRRELGKRPIDEQAAVDEKRKRVRAAPMKGKKKPLEDDAGMERS